jgi:hypothetical protein
LDPSDIARHVAPPDVDDCQESGEDGRIGTVLAWVADRTFAGSQQDCVQGESFHDLPGADRWDGSKEGKDSQ